MLGRVLDGSPRGIPGRGLIAGGRRAGWDAGWSRRRARCSAKAEHAASRRRRRGEADRWSVHPRRRRRASGARSSAANPRAGVVAPNDPRARLGGWSRRGV
jgi:hypothetical protein